MNRHLPPEERVSLGTVSNYERAPVEGRAGGAPRATFVAGLKRAFPELRLAWLLLGDGEPTVAEETARGAAGLAETGPPEGASLADRAVARYPDLEILSPEAGALFVGTLARYAVAEPGMRLGEEEILELAGDLRWLLLLPLSLWGFDRTPAYADFADYAVAMLHALGLALAGPGEGDPVERREAFPLTRLRRDVEVGFAEA